MAFLPMLIVGILVKLSSPGPILFRQKRLTLGAQEFVILKFRTMQTNFDTSAKGIQVRGNSAAITPIGKFLRRSKLDELPQFFNILIGDMSFVGPRPELPRRLEYYSDADKRIFSVRSGVTSPASILLSDEEYLMNKVSDPEKFYLQVLMPFKIKLNIEYILNYNLFLDFKVLVATLLRIAGFNCSKLVLFNAQFITDRNAINKISEGF